MSALPWSLSWFVLTGVIYLLQLFPWTGIFLMFLMAPFWSVLTVNLGFICLAFEAAFGSVSRLWLALPAVWFGAYAGGAYQSTQELQRLDAEIRASNARQVMPFDPGNGALVVQDGSDSLYNFAQSIVRDYRIPVAYAEPRRQQQRSNGLAQLTTDVRAWRAGSAETCTRIRNDKRLAGAGIYGATLDRSNGLCIYSSPEDPKLPEWRIEAKSEPIHSRLLSGKITRITLIAANGQKIELRAGQAAALAKFPMPIMGCWLNSGRPSWECTAQFARGTNQGLGGEGQYGRAAVEVVAKALRLQSRSGAASTPEAPTPAAPLEGPLASRDDAALANLERVLADPSIRATVHDLAGLAQRTDVIAERASRILVAMSKALEHGRGESETARNLQGLLASLPDAQFQSIGAELLRRLDEGRPQQSTPASRRSTTERLDGRLTTRLGDLGSSALPILTRLSFVPRPDAQAILGLCRLGAPAAHLAERLAEHARSGTTRTSDQRAAAYVTLVRWGRSDLAEALLEPENQDWQRRNYASRWPGLKEGAGSDVCTLRYRV